MYNNNSGAIIDATSSIYVCNLNTTFDSSEGIIVAPINLTTVCTTYAVADTAPSTITSTITMKTLDLALATLDITVLPLDLFRYCLLLLLSLFDAYSLSVLLYITGVCYRTKSGSFPLMGFPSKYDNGFILYIPMNHIYEHTNHTYEHTTV